jgi:predicted dehydrogenase
MRQAHIHYSTEKPLFTSAKDARKMERLARQANIKLMVNYGNAWAAPSHNFFHGVRAGEVGGDSEDHRGVWTRRAEGDWSLAAIRKLVL